MKILPKIHIEEFRPLSSLDNDSINDLIAESNFKKYKANYTIDFTLGGLFLRGLLLFILY